MVYFVVPGRGSWEGYHLVCRASRSGTDPVVVRAFEDAEEASDHCNDLNEASGDTAAESLPAEMQIVLSKIT